MKRRQICEILVVALGAVLLALLERSFVRVVKVPALEDLSRLERNLFGQRMALILPFTMKDAQALVDNINLEWSQHPPCSEKKRYSDFIDLVLYYHRSWESMPFGMQQILKAAVKKWAWCFDRVRYISAELSDAEDEYPLGPSNMFFKLFQLEQLQSYKTIFWMEPDVHTCQKHWLNRLYEEGSVDADFWIRGSLLRRTHTDEYSTYTFDQHINGNAWYRIGNEEFRNFLKSVEAAFRKDPDRFLNSWDVAIELERLEKKSKSWEAYAELCTKFSFSVTIQNVYRAPVKLKEICKQHSETYLIHGRNVL